jgi:hypothetical protein
MIYESPESQTIEFGEISEEDVAENSYLSRDSIYISKNGEAIITPCLKIHSNIINKLTKIEFEDEDKKEKQIRSYLRIEAHIREKYDHPNQGRIFEVFMNFIQKKILFP